MISNDSRENYTPIINYDFVSLQIDELQRKKEQSVTLCV